MSGQRGCTWWLLIGCWWRPLCWAGRVTLWLVAWPLGLWRSMRHAQRTRQVQERQGSRF